MPCDQHTFIDDYIDVLSEIYTDISIINSANAIILKHFIFNECLQLAILYNMSSVTHTFISALNTQSLIDHFILPEILFDCIMIYKQVDSIDIISDHLPVLLHLNCNIGYSIETESIFISDALWSPADETQIKIYRKH